MNEKVLLFFAFLAFLSICSVLPTNVQQQTSFKLNSSEQKNSKQKVVKSQIDNKTAQIKNIVQVGNKQQNVAFGEILPQSCIEALVFAMREYAKFGSPGLFSEISLAIILIQHSSALMQFLVSQIVQQRQHEKNNINNGGNKDIINYPKPQSPKNNKGSGFIKGQTGSKSRDFRNDQLPHETGYEPIAGCLHVSRCPNGYLCRYNICVSKKVVEKIHVILEERKNSADQDYEWNRWEDWDDSMVKNQPEQQQNQIQNQKAVQESQQSGDNLNKQSQLEYSDDEYDNGDPLNIQQNGQTSDQQQKNEQPSQEFEGQNEQQNVQGASDENQSTNDYQQQYYPMSPSKQNDG